MLSPVLFKRELRALTGLRFFTAFHVMLLHTVFLIGKKHIPLYLYRFISFGESAVSLFFILSGFILTYVYTSDNFTFETSRAKFYIARFSKIYPLYLFALLIDLPRGISFFFGKYDLIPAAVKSSLSFSGHLLMLQSWIPQITPAWNAPGWSLSTEAFFYLVFPVLIPYFLRTRNSLAIGVGAICLQTAAYFLLSGRFNLEAGAAATFWRSFPALRLGEFVIGICAGMLFLKGKAAIAGRIPTSFLIVLSWSSVFFLDFFPKALISVVFLNMLFALLILNLALSNGPIARILSTDVCVYLGKISFALYILHVPLLSYFDMFSIEVGLNKLFLYILFVLGFSICSYHSIEVIALRKIRSTFEARFSITAT